MRRNSVRALILVTLLGGPLAACGSSSDDSSGDDSNNPSNATGSAGSAGDASSNTTDNGTKDGSAGSAGHADATTDGSGGSGGSTTDGGAGGGTTDGAAGSGGNDGGSGGSAGSGGSDSGSAGSSGSDAATADGAAGSGGSDSGNAGGAGTGGSAGSDDAGSDATLGAGGSAGSDDAGSDATLGAGGSAGSDDAGNDATLGAGGSAGSDASSGAGGGAGSSGDAGDAAASGPNIFDSDDKTLAILELNGDFTDSSGHGRDATTFDPGDSGGTSSESFVSTAWGQGLSMTGDGQFQGVDWSQYASLLTGTYTYELVLKPNATDCYYRLYAYQRDNDDGWYFCDEFDSYIDASSTEDNLAGSTAIPWQQRLYLALIVRPGTDGGDNTVDVYENGVFQGTVDAGFTGLPTDVVFFRDDGDENYSGVADAIRISSGARTQEEISAVETKLETRPDTSADAGDQ